MNPISAIPASRRARLAKKAKQKGVALVTVLAILLLMTVLILSFFTMATSELKSSEKEAEGLRARSLADAAVNMAIAQLREATTLLDASGRVSPWSSQPGAVRTFRQDGKLFRLFKLYSAKTMVVGNMATVPDDVPRDWQSKPAQFIDLNSPMIKPDLRSPQNLALAQLTFPIVDPRAMKGSAKNSVEGFSYKDNFPGAKGPNGGAAQQRVPMPVRWLYTLADGTIGTLDDSGKWLSGGGQASPNAQNPIVGRVAFWTDDETCKVNVNTASEGVFWDTPRVSTGEDESLGKYQPANGEYQRYPGHPAMVCLSSILFPNRRWFGDNAQANGANAMAALSKDEVQALWRLSPYISDSEKGSKGGHATAGSLTDLVAKNDGTFAPRLEATPLGKHIYTSFDDLLFDVESDTASSQGASTPRKVFFKDDGKLVSRLREARFFATTHSAAPEITLFGTPRVSLWPVSLEAASQEVSTGGKFTVLDKMIAFDSFIGGQPYYFQRLDAGSRHAEAVNAGSSRIRNKDLNSYLNGLINKSIPGYGPRKTGDAATLAQKYSTNFTNGPYGDAANIIAMMLDYIRQTNLYDGNLSEAQRYGTRGLGSGQIAPICLCRGSDWHAANWNDNTKLFAKGLGRMMTISEVALMMVCRYDGTQDQPIGTPGEGIENRTKGFRHWDIGLLTEAFVPAHGWGEHRPTASVILNAGISSATTAYITNIGTIAGQQLQPLRANSGTANTAQNEDAPSSWLGWGGSAGVRVLQNMIRMKPIFKQVEKGAPPPPVDYSGTIAGGTPHPTLVVYDDPGGAAAANQGNLIQAVEIPMPDIKVNGNMVMPLLDGTMPGPLDSRFNAARGSSKTVPEQLKPLFFGDLNGLGANAVGEIVQSLVPSHGDFRLLASKRLVGPNVGVTLSRGGHPVNSNPIFVAHPRWGLQPLAHSFKEPLPEAANTILRADKPSRQAMPEPLDGYFKDLKLKPYYVPDFPIRPYDTINIRAVVDQRAQDWSGGQGGEVRASQIFGWNRGDGNEGSETRGSCDPAFTGDFDNGVGFAPDGPYMNKIDDGEVESLIQKYGRPYFSRLISKAKLQSSSPGAFAPNRQVPSSGMFGSLPTGVQANVPWQTLLFRPGGDELDSYNRTKDHYGWANPRDHLWMDFFWMPIVEPYLISEPFETKGKINMNYQILPFGYITRATALHALMKAEKMTVIPDNDAEVYKQDSASGSGYKTNNGKSYRSFIDATQTLEQWEEVFKKGDAFISPTQICEMYLVPEGTNYSSRSQMRSFWSNNKLTGDNSKERPYTNLYPRLTTRSNAYRVHVYAQSLRKVKGTPVDSFEAGRDQVTGEFRGSMLVQRSIDPGDPQIEDYVTLIRDEKAYEVLDSFYTFRIADVNQFAN